MAALTATNKKDSLVTITPGLGTGGPGPGSIQGSYRAVRCTLSGSYTPGTDTLPDLGMKEVLGVLAIAGGTNDVLVIGR